MSIFKKRKTKSSDFNIDINSDIFSTSFTLGGNNTNEITDIDMLTEDDD